MVAQTIEKTLMVYRWFASQPTCLYSQFVLAHDLNEATTIAKSRAAQMKNSKFGFIVPEVFCPAKYVAVNELGIYSMLDDADKVTLAAIAADDLHLAVKRKIVEFQRHDWLHEMRQRRTHYARWN